MNIRVMDGMRQRGLFVSIRDRLLVRARGLVVVVVVVMVIDSVYHV